MNISRKWTLKTGDKVHVIEADYGVHIVDSDSGDLMVHRDGALLVDGTSVNTWNEDLPKQISIEIEGKPAIFKKAGMFTKVLELTFDNVKIKPD